MTKNHGLVSYNGDLAPLVTLVPCDLIHSSYLHEHPEQRWCRNIHTGKHSNTYILMILWIYSPVLVAPFSWLKNIKILLLQIVLRVSLHRNIGGMQACCKDCCLYLQGKSLTFCLYYISLRNKVFFLSKLRLSYRKNVYLIRL